MWRIDIAVTHLRPMTGMWRLQNGRDANTGARTAGAGLRSDRMDHSNGESAQLHVQALVQATELSEGTQLLNSQ